MNCVNKCDFGTKCFAKVEHFVLRLIETLESDHYSRKLKADLFIDDRNLGGLPEWGMIYRMIHDKWGYEDIYQSSDNKEENKKRSFWKILFSKM